MGNSLYKFRTINDNSISGLMNDNIFGSTPDAFNDPYDSLFQYDIDKIYELVKIKLFFCPQSITTLLKFCLQ